MQLGRQVAIANVKSNTPVLTIKINEDYVLQDTSRLDELRTIEKSYYRSSDGDFSTWMIFDEKSRTEEQALYSIYTTVFVTFLLVVRTYIHTYIHTHMHTCNPITSSVWGLYTAKAYYLSVYCIFIIRSVLGVN
jgi:hypothetical protein